MVFLIFLVSFVVSFVVFPMMILRLKRAGIVGKNMNSEKREEIPEMGGLIIAAGFGAGIVFAIFIRTFYNLFLSASLISVLAVLATVLIVVLIGIIDDLISISQLILRHLCQHLQLYL